LTLASFLLRQRLGSREDVFVRQRPRPEWQLVEHALVVAAVAVVPVKSQDVV